MDDSSAGDDDLATHSSFEAELLDDWDIDEWNDGTGTQGSQNKTNHYVESLIQSSGLQILQEGRANRAFQAKENKELALFHLFFKKEFLEIIRTWLNKRLQEKTSSKQHYSQALVL